ncbi:MAG: hypothetical protein J3K34DRAFT_417627 [Monoraphidium minutum]|nr:MAG: hypothetical protein J3K34DRAFT_417627 [Monoraphidium minutum]
MAVSGWVAAGGPVGAALGRPPAAGSASLAAACCETAAPASLGLRIATQHARGGLSGAWRVEVGLVIWSARHVASGTRHQNLGGAPLNRRAQRRAGAGRAHHGGRPGKGRGRGGEGGRGMAARTPKGAVDHDTHRAARAGGWAEQTPLCRAQARGTRRPQRWGTGSAHAAGRDRRTDEIARNR